LKKIGIVGFSFGLTDAELNSCNIKLAEEIMRISSEQVYIGNKVIVVAQWEIAKALKYLGLDIEHIVNRNEGIYLDGDMVMAEETSVFKAQEIKEAIVVANPFLHLATCQEIARKSGFEVVKEKIKQIGFCKDSLQWWTRNSLFLITYGIRMKILGKRG
jgi:hypothetical protein